MFAMFDCVYIVANGQCVYQGAEHNIIPYVQSLGLSCPLTYNPADFSKLYSKNYLIINKLFD